MTKRVLNGLFVFLICVALTSSAYATMRCSGRIITAKNTKDEILASCGEPTEKKQRLREIKIRNCASVREYGDYDNEHEYYAEKAADPCIRIIAIEEWFYNFGSTRFTYTVHIEDDQVVELKRGSHGY